MTKAIASFTLQTRFYGILKNLDKVVWLYMQQNDMQQAALYDTVDEIYQDLCYFSKTDKVLSASSKDLLYAIALNIKDNKYQYDSNKLWLNPNNISREVVAGFTKYNIGGLGYIQSTEEFSRIKDYSNCYINVETCLLLKD